MACAGVDFGSRRGVIAIARRGGVDICVNEVSNRATPCAVSFVGEQRHIGEAAANFMAQNPRGTITSIQRLLGTAYDSPFTQNEISRLTAKVTKTAAGGVAAAVDYGSADGNDCVPSVELPFESLAGMLFSSFLQIASDEYKSPVRDCVITVPGYYTDCQRRAVVAAASIGNVNVLRVVSEHAAIAFSYGIFRALELPDTTPIKVAFVDMGNASTTVFIASFTKAGAEINSVSFDPSLGGRDFDNKIAAVFNEQFKEKYGIDALSKPRPSLRLMKEAEKVKRVLSANAEAPLNIECLMDDKDVAAKMTRDEFEDLAKPVLDKLKDCCSRAISDAKLAADEKLFSVEIVGASTRVPAVKKVVTDVFAPLGAPLKTTLNMDECIARGAALIAAGLSPAFSVRPYALTDISSYAIDAEKVFDASESPEVMELVPRFNTVPCTKALTFKPRGPLSIVLRYHDEAALTQGTSSADICTYKVEAPDDAEAKVRAKIRINASGVAELSSVVLSKEVEVLEDVPQPVEMPATDQKRFEVPAPGEPKENGKHDRTPEKEGSSMNERPAENGTVESPVPMSETDGAKQPEATPMDTEPTVDSSAEAGQGGARAEPVVAEKRMVKKVQQTDVPVTLLAVAGNGLTTEEIKLAIEKEAQMKATDLYLKERSDALNGLEGYVYDLRSRIEEYGDLKDFGPEEVRVPLKKELDDAEEWIYSEEGEKANKSTFNDRKAVLVAKAAPMLKRKREREDRPAAVSALEATLESYKKLAVPAAEEFAHIPDAEKDKALKCVEGATLWLRDAMAKQEALPLHVDPTLTCAAINAKRVEVDALCGPIQRTPKPTPPKEDPKSGEAKEVEAADKAKRNGKDAEQAAGSGAPESSAKANGNANEGTADSSEAPPVPSGEPVGRTPVSEDAMETS